MKTEHKTDARRLKVRGLSLQCACFGDGLGISWHQIDEIGVSHVDPLRKEYPELASMLTDPPHLVGKRVRFIAVVKDQHGETERVRTRVWTDGNIGTYRNMSKENSQMVSVGFMAKLITAVEAGDTEAIPRVMRAEGC